MSASDRIFRLSITVRAYDNLVEHAHYTGFIHEDHRGGARGLSNFLEDLAVRPPGLSTWKYTPPLFSESRDPYKGLQKRQLPLSESLAYVLRVHARAHGIPTWEMLEALGDNPPRLVGPLSAYSPTNGDTARRRRDAQAEARREESNTLPDFSAATIDRAIAENNTAALIAWEKAHGLNFTEQEIKNGSTTDYTPDPTKILTQTESARARWYETRRAHVENAK